MGIALSVMGIYTHADADLPSVLDLHARNIDSKSLDFAVIRQQMKLFRSSNKEAIAECQRYFGFPLSSKLREKGR